ncbi:MAG: hypothetical protein HUJ63_09500, partial [Enterococcus sp.]|nr:hypothetical protein [Enterococcus sp.]
ISAKFDNTFSPSFGADVPTYKLFTDIQKTSQVESTQETWWYSDDYNKPAEMWPEAKIFEKGLYYCVECQVKPKEGYEFADKMTFNIVDTKGNKLEMKEWTDKIDSTGMYYYLADDNNYYLYCLYPLLQEQNITIKADFDYDFTPVVGHSVPTKQLFSNITCDGAVFTSPYNESWCYSEDINNQNWWPTATKFERGYYYEVAKSLYFNTTDGIDFSKINVVVNGEKVLYWGLGITVSEGGYYYYDYKDKNGKTALALSYVYNKAPKINPDSGGGDNNNSSADESSKSGSSSSSLSSSTSDNVMPFTVLPMIAIASLCAVIAIRKRAINN